MGKWFNRVCLVETGFKKPNDRSLNFHSFRHRCVTNLKRMGANHEHVEQIVGHAPSGTTNENYHHGYELPTLKATIDLIPDHRTL